MDETTYISSVGLRAFVSAQKKINKTGGSMVLTHVKPCILEIFEVTGFAGVRADRMKREPVRDELSFEQKVWKGGQTLLWSLRPVALYLFFPALLMSVGMLLFGGRSAETVIGRSGNFYYALGMAATVFLLHKRSRKQGSSLWRSPHWNIKGCP